MSQVELVEAFLVVDQPRQRVGHWTEALAALDAEHTPSLTSVVGYYDAKADQALIDLRYDLVALGEAGLRDVLEIARLADITMIQPDDLSDGERRRFYNERLAQCSVLAPRQRSVVAALTEIVRKLKEQKKISTPPPIPRAVLEPRGDTSDPVPLVHAKGTGNDLSTVIDRLPRATRRDELVQTTSKHVVQRTALMTPADPALRVVTDTQIVDVEDDLPPAPPATGRVGTPSRVELPQAHMPLPGNQPMIYARYLRSGRWVPTRIGALSLKGAALMTGALPRLHDHVDVALSYGGHRALVRGAVGKVSTVREAQQTGASTFSVAFQLDDTARRQLTELLTAARAANVTIKPAPPRSTRRFPVEWPVCIGTVKGAIKAEALDVSTHGMFVRTPIALERGSLSFSVVLDDGAAPIAGRAKVVRQIGETEAQACGLAAGFGLTILDMGEADRARWSAFLARVERRSERRVLVGAAPTRLAELQGHLASAGYAVIGGTDPGALVQLANASVRPVDAALIDATWLKDGPAATWIESLFSARNVPCVTLHGDPRKARNAVDRLLEVVD